MQTNLLVLVLALLLVAFATSDEVSQTKRKVRRIATARVNLLIQQRRLDMNDTQQGNNNDSDNGNWPDNWNNTDDSGEDWSNNGNNNTDSDGGGDNQGDGEYEYENETKEYEYEGQVLNKTNSPTKFPTFRPTKSPTFQPTKSPTKSPTIRYIVQKKGKRHHPGHRPPRHHHRG